MKKAVTSLGLLFVLSPFAMAQDDPNFYLGGRVGGSILDNTCQTEECTSKEIGGGIIAGYDFANGFSLETTFDYLGNMEIKENDLLGFSALKSGQTSMITFAPKYNFFVTQNSSIFAKVGGAYWNWDDKLKGVNDLSLMTALGLEHRATDLINLRLEYQYTPEMGLGSATTNPLVANHHYVTAGVTFHFGRKSAPVQPPVAEDYLVDDSVYDDSLVEEEIVIEAEEVLVNEASDEASFEFAQSKLSASALNKLDPMLKRLQEYNQSTAVIIGNTDNTGPESFNQSLSVERAQSVADYFNANGISSERMTVTGRGSSDPIATNDTKEGRAMNRRVAIDSPEFILEQQ